MNRRRKGTHFEYKVRDYLKELGCFVTKSTVSRFPDLIAITEGIIGEVWFVECKSNKYLNKREKKELKEYRGKYGIIPFVAYPKFSVYSKKPGNIILEEVK